MADNVLYMGVRGVTDLMVKPGVVNLDFADIRTVMAEMGKAMMGTGEAEGDDRAVKAAEAAISNPLLEDTSLRGARGVLINITGGLDMTLFEVDEAANRIRKEVDEDANIIFGSSVEEDLNGRLRVSVVATGIDAAASAAQPAQARRRRRPPLRPRPETLTLVPGKPSAASARRAGDGLPVGADGRAPARGGRRRSDGAARPGLADGRRTPPRCRSARSPCRRPRTRQQRRPAPRSRCPTARRPNPCGAAWAAPRRPPVPGVSNGIRRIFQEMTGAGLMRRNPHPPEQPLLAPRRGAAIRRVPRAPAWLSARRSQRRSASTSRPSCAVNPTDCAKQKLSVFNGLRRNMQKQGLTGASPGQVRSHSLGAGQSVAFQRGWDREWTVTFRSRRVAAAR